jgi:Rrf2 family protein
MQLTRAADYAVRVMIHLAALPPGTRISQVELAKAVDCPGPFLAKVLQRLARAGLIATRRGNAGGIELPDMHRSASMLAVVEAIEGPVRLNICLDSGHSCPRQSWCPAHSVWAACQVALTNILQNSTISDLAQLATGCHVCPEDPRWN